MIQTKKLDPLLDSPPFRRRKNICGRFLPSSARRRVGAGIALKLDSYPLLKKLGKWR